MTKAEWRQLKRRVARAPKGSKQTAMVRLRDAVHADLARAVARKGAES